MQALWQKQEPQREKAMQSKERMAAFTLSTVNLVGLAPAASPSLHPAFQAARPPPRSPGADSLAQMDEEPRRNSVGRFQPVAPFVTNGSRKEMPCP
jgi:hypothetical protein